MASSGKDLFYKSVSQMADRGAGQDVFELCCGQQLLLRLPFLN